MYTETLGRWHTVDLFVGLAYLSNKEQAVWPAADIAAKGQPVAWRGTQRVSAGLKVRVWVRVRMLLLLECWWAVALGRVVTGGGRAASWCTRITVPPL